MRPDHPIPTLRRGQRLKTGDIARTNAGVPREIVGGKDATVRTIGGRAIITAKKGKGGGGGGGTPRLVAVLPAIGGNYTRVTWCSSGTLTGGTGDDQVWVADGRVGQTEYTPEQYATSLSGVPV